MFREPKVRFFKHLYAPMRYELACREEKRKRREMEGGKRKAKLK